MLPGADWLATVANVLNPAPSPTPSQGTPNAEVLLQLASHPGASETQNDSQPWPFTAAAAVRPPALKFYCACATPKKQSTQPPGTRPIQSKKVGCPFDVHVRLFMGNTGRCTPRCAR